MAGRFSKLDFDEQPRERVGSNQADAWPDEDEKICLRKGDDQFDEGFYEQALAAYSRALRYNRDSVEAWTGQVRCLICLGEFREAVLWSDRALERMPKSPDLLACKGVALFKRGDTQEGMEYLDGAVEMRSPSAWVWAARGECLLQSAQTRENAHRCFLKALEIAPDDARAALWIGMVYNRAQMYARARTPLLTAVKKLSRSALALYQAGLMHEGLGEFPQASGFYQQALTLKPNVSEIRDALDRVQSNNPVARLWRKMQSKG